MCAIRGGGRGGESGRTGGIFSLVRLMSTSLSPDRYTRGGKSAMRSTTRSPKQGARCPRLVCRATAEGGAAVSLALLTRVCPSITIRTLVVYALRSAQGQTMSARYTQQRVTLEGHLQLRGGRKVDTYSCRCCQVWEI